MKLEARLVEKPWGRTQLPRGFPATDGRQIGELWFATDGEVQLPLLAKYIFTSERLSIQVHPNDVQAQARGLPHGKTECWYIVDVEPGAELGIGLKSPMGGESLRAAALDGSIEDMMEWIPVSAGDFFYVPAGTVHAIGAGVSVIELQQNIDVTYRLYDYGRPRELHLDDGIDVSRPEPYDRANSIPAGEAGDRPLIDGPIFTLLRTSDANGDAARLSDRERWVLPLEGAAHGTSATAVTGECLLLAPDEKLTLDAGSRILIGAMGSLSGSAR